jgi:hypothetical protein
MYLGEGTSLPHQYWLCTCKWNILRYRRHSIRCKNCFKKSLLQVRIMGLVPIFRNSNLTAPLYEQKWANLDKFRDWIYLIIKIFSQIYKHAIRNVSGSRVRICESARVYVCVCVCDINFLYCTGILEYTLVQLRKYKKNLFSFGDYFFSSETENHRSVCNSPPLYLITIRRQKPITSRSRTLRANFNIIHPNYASLSGYASKIFSLPSKVTSALNDMLSDHNNFNVNFMSLDTSVLIAFPSITLVPTDEYNNSKRNCGAHYV